MATCREDVPADGDLHARARSSDTLYSTARIQANPPLLATVISDNGPIADSNGLRSIFDSTLAGGLDVVLGAAADPAGLVVGRQDIARDLHPGSGRLRDACNARSRPGHGGTGRTSASSLHGVARSAEGGGATLGPIPTRYADRWRSRTARKSLGRGTLAQVAASTWTWTTWAVARTSPWGPQNA